MDEAGGMDGSAIVAGSEAPELLHAAKASFEVVAVFVDGFVMWMETFSVPLGWDHCLGLHAGNQCAQIVAVIALSARIALARSFQEIGCSRDVMRLTNRDLEWQRHSERVSQHMDPGRDVM